MQGYFSFYFLIFILISGSAELCGQQTQTDSYTRYELLSPETQSFRIIYDVSATKSGMKYYWNGLRKGSEHSVDEVLDLSSGKLLEWKIVDGMEAKENGLTRASVDGEYLQIKLARSIPENGQARLRIDKTYKDIESYYEEDGSIVFSRSLGIKRNSVVLPLNYELIHCNYPSQVQLTNDGRVKISFMNDGPSAAPLVVKARKLDKGVTIKSPKANAYKYNGSGSSRNKSEVRAGWEFEERSFQNRDIVYFLQQPETHAFKLYHDYTETRVGMDRYLNIVRAGSKASDPSAILLDTGEELKVEELKGPQISKRGIDIGSEIMNETEVIAIWYDPVKQGQSKRLRITETYTDPNRYQLVGDQLVWDRSFGRNRNTVILPEGWILTSSSIPAKIDLTDDGLVRLRFINGRPDNIDVYITAQRNN